MKLLNELALALENPNWAVNTEFATQGEVSRLANRDRATLGTKPRSGDRT
jgi:hypothetical protein